jgi:hypothetical protein
LPVWQIPSLVASVYDRRILLGKARRNAENTKAGEVPSDR